MLIPDLLSTKAVDVRRALEQLAEELSRHFSDDEWFISEHFGEWTPESKESVWNNELRVGDRQTLSKGPFQAWLGEVQFASASVTSRLIFGRAHVRSNAGWRLTLMTFPPLKVPVVGLAHHYQGSQNQNKLCSVSNFLHDVLQVQLQGSTQDLDEAIFGRKVTSNDWDVTGLTVPGQPVGGVAWPGAPPLRLARTTTVKKTLSTFITIRRLDPGTTDDDLRELLRRFRALMRTMVE